MKRIPRKLKKKIPKGVYCYVFTGKTSNVWNSDTKSFVTSYHTKNCPFNCYEQIKDLPSDLIKELDEDNEFPNEYIEYCKYLKTDIMDSCKSCSINKYLSNGNIRTIPIKSINT